MADEFNWIQRQAKERNTSLIDKSAHRSLDELPPRYLVQRVHLTCPATVWKYIEKAAGAGADLVMLDLEDSIPRNDDALLQTGRTNVIRAFRELDFGKSIRTFRPRGLELDPEFSDIISVVSEAGDKIHGLIYPKVESAEEVKSLDRVLTDLEKACRLEPGSLTLQVLIESVHAEKNLDAIAAASPRLVGLIFGAFDYWGSLALAPHLYRPDHPIIADLRCKLIKAAAAAGIPAIAEMTLNFPTSNKSEEERQQAMDQCKADSQLACSFGFAGKWAGIPAQVEIVKEAFSIPEHVIERALREAKAYQKAEREGKGAVMIDGSMADRATDRINRVTLKQAYALGLVPEEAARELRLTE